MSSPRTGISAEVIDLRTLKPMDIATIIESVKKTGRVVTVEEGWRQSGVGAEIAASVTEHAFDWLDAPVTRVSARTCRCPTRPISRNWRCLGRGSGRGRPRQSVTGEV
jgi:pyruvate dehydrogenase E1 component beta subunit